MAEFFAKFEVIPTDIAHWITLGCSGLMATALAFSIFDNQKLQDTLLREAGPANAAAQQQQQVPQQ